MSRLDLVTGAFSYSGSHIARRLLDTGHARAHAHPPPRARHPLRDEVDARRYRFDDPAELARSLTGVTTLYNTYWVRFDHGASTYRNAVESSRMLFAAARRAGVERIVHVSITNPSISSRLPYFRGKALVESAWRNPVRRTRSSGRPGCSAASATCSSTTSPGSCGGCRCSRARRWALPGAARPRRGPRAAVRAGGRRRRGRGDRCRRARADELRGGGRARPQRRRRVRADRAGAVPADGARGAGARRARLRRGAHPRRDQRPDLGPAGLPRPAARASSRSAPGSTSTPTRSAAATRTSWSATSPSPEPPAPRDGGRLLPNTPHRCCQSHTRREAFGGAGRR